MEVLKGQGILISIISAAEHDQIPLEIATKIDEVLSEKFEDLFTSNALMQTVKDDAEQSLGEFKVKYDALEANHDTLAGQLLAVADLRTELGANATELATVRAQCGDLESEAAKLRHERRLATDERDAATAMVSRRDGEVGRLQQDLKTMQDQLRREVETRCEAQTQLGDIESRILQLEYREKRVEQERTLFNTQVNSLERQITTRTDELLATRRETSGRCVILETHLATVRDEHVVLQQQHAALRQQHTDLLESQASAQQERCDDKRAAYQRLDAVQLELDAQRRLAELYKVDADAKGKLVLELEQALEEAKVRLDEAVERYGDLETETKAERLAHDELLAKKAECIALLRQELQTANDLLGQAKTSTTAAAADVSKLFSSDGSKSGMSVTQIYNQYVRASEQLVEEREEVDRLRGYIQKIMDELQEKGPLLARQRDDLEHAIATVEQLTHTQDELTRENDQLRTRCADQKRRCECERLRAQLHDMGRQICKLLQQRDLLAPDHGDDATTTGESNAQDIISKRLVTFASIAELQQNNQRLLAVVRELSAKQEHLEHTEQLDHVLEQLERLREAHADLLEQQQRQHKLTKMLTGQRDTYRTLYQQAVKSEQPVTQLERPPYDLVDGNSSMEDGDESNSSKVVHPADPQLKEKMQQMEGELAQAQKQLAQLNADNDTYRKEKSANEKALIEVNERMRQESQQLAGSNSALTITLDTTQLHLQTSKRNTDVLRKQLDPLEERIRIHGQAQVKLETSLTHHKDSLYEATTKLSKSEVLLGQAQKDVAVLTDANDRLLKERETFRLECQNMTVLHANVALIKATLERSDAESRLRMEESLAEQQRECSALRRRLQEEQDHFRTLAEDLQTKAGAAERRMEEERAAAERLRTDVAQMRNDLQTKAEHVHQLQAAQPGGVSQGENSNNGNYRDMEQRLQERQSELDALKQKLNVAKLALDQHTNVAEVANRQLTVLNEQYSTYRGDTERQMDEHRARVAELQAKCEDLEGELTLNRTDHSDEQDRTRKLRFCLTSATDQMASLKATVATQNAELEQSRRVADGMSDKYSREVALHSDDLRALAELKTTLDRVQGELRELRTEHDNLQAEHVQKEEGWRTRDELMNREKEQLKQRFDELIAQNTLLHDQIQQMNADMSVLQVRRTESMGGNLSLNRSLTEEDVQNADSQLVKIVKYLRQEKDYALNKAEIVESEQKRLRLDLELAQKQLSEAREALDEERHKSETVLVGNAKYAEVLRKVETMNAITDSNRTLRSERDQLLAQVAELRADVAKLETDAAPLQEQLAGLQRRCDALQGESATLRGEATRWRQRANTLIEKTNRTSPEDWKKLQTERETLAKQLTIERANVVRLNDDLTTANRERAKLDEAVKTLRSTAAQLKDAIDEMVAVKTELQQLKTDHSQLNADHITLGKDVSGKDGQLADLRNQLAQVRKIAKKYKVQCEELQAAAVTTAADTAQLTERVGKLEEDMRAQQDTSSATIAQLTAKSDASLQEVERTMQQMQASKERFAALIKNAKDRIVELTQAKNKAEAERDRLQLQSGVAAGPSGDNSSEGGSTDELVAVKLERMEQEKERLRGEVEELKRLLEESATNGVGLGGSNSSTGQTTDSRTVGVATEQPTVAVAPHRATNIKPMMSVAHPHVASIRPHRATVTTTPSTLAVPPQQVQVQVHTTAPSTSGIATADNSSPTSSHEQQQQLPTIRVLPLVVDTSGSSSTSTTASASTSSSSTSTAAVVGVVSATTAQPPPPQASATTAAASTSIAVAPIVAAVTASTSTAGSSSSSSATVTTSGVKRTRSAEDSDSTTTTTAQVPQQVTAAGTSSAAAGKVQAQVQPLVKRSRMGGATQQQQRPVQPVQVHQQQQLDGSQEEQQQLVEASDEGGGGDGMPPVEQAEADDAAAGDVEYQVPTSSQRDHDDDVDEREQDMEDDADEEDNMQVIDLVESDDEDDDEDNEDDDDDAEAAAAENAAEEEELEDADEEEEDEEEIDDEETGEDEAVDRRRKRRRLEDEDVVDDEEEQDEDVVEEHGVEDEGDEAAVAAVAAAAAILSDAEDAERQEGQQMEATSSSGSGRQQPVAPMAAVSSRQHQQQQLLLPDECADDSIVPSTPTLFLPRRGTSGDGVSSPHPHVPTVGPGHRLFTFATTGATVADQQLAAASGGEQEVLEQQHQLRRDEDGPGGQVATGRSVPSTPHHVLHSPPPTNVAASTDGEEAGNGSQLQQVEGSEEAIVAAEANATPGGEDEGREAEATPATVPSAQQQQPGASGSQRRSTRPVSSSSSSSNSASVGQTGPGGSRQVTPIVWDNQQPGQLHRTSPRHAEVRGRGLPVQRARRSRGAMLPRGAHTYSRY